MKFSIPHVRVPIHVILSPWVDNPALVLCKSARVVCVSAARIESTRLSKSFKLSLRATRTIIIVDVMPYTRVNLFSQIDRLRKNIDLLRCMATPGVEIKGHTLGPEPHLRPILVMKTRSGIG